MIFYQEEQTEPPCIVDIFTHRYGMYYFIILILCVWCRVCVVFVCVRRLFFLFFFFWRLYHYLLCVFCFTNIKNTFLILFGILHTPLHPYYDFNFVCVVFVCALCVCVCVCVCVYVCRLFFLIFFCRLVSVP